MPMDTELKRALNKLGLGDSETMIISDLADHATTEALAAITRVVQTAPEHLRYYVALLAFTYVSQSASKAINTQAMTVGQQILKGL